MFINLVLTSVNSVYVGSVEYGVVDRHTGNGCSSVYQRKLAASAAISIGLSISCQADLGNYYATRPHQLL